MEVFKGIILCLSISLVSCDYACYSKSVGDCFNNVAEQRRGKDPGSEDEKFCQLYSDIALCQRNAAVQCSTGFADVAEKAYSAIIDICTEGTETYKAIKSDPKCNLASVYNSQGCNKDLDEAQKDIDSNDVVANMKLICIYIDSIKDCATKNFEKCGDQTKKAFNSLLASSIELQKKSCNLIP
ncbi:uncharacterized protein [Parasteatoda tepidariorum]|uniref:uncharacterized protein n=1 Tax=Parasteatoda tepidariorum TaxID=114398 RepID=UPI001C71C793|nr:uncharacterized protein LOC107441708 isoform X2 [Parasteatoda tepidariorum]XP_042904802.1 uncharacterized protein LOC107441708 isoform X1 [Parasteatoda tepidariorum]